MFDSLSKKQKWLIPLAIESLIVIVIFGFAISSTGIFDQSQHDIELEIRQFDRGGPGLNVDYIELRPQKDYEDSSLVNISANLSEVNQSLELDGGKYDLKVNTKLGNIYNTTLDIQESQRIRVYGLGIATANGSIVSGDSGLSGFKTYIHQEEGKMELRRTEDEKGESSA